jgi:hexosaminidase
MNNTTISWQASQTPAELHSVLKTLGEEYPIVEGGDSGINTEFIKSDIQGMAKVTITKGQAVITYSRVEHAARALGSLLGGVETDEQASFKTLGIMLDCSRNAVMKVEHLKKWLRRLSLMGYNMAMLYTEDTYQLPGEPYFGYLRGPYTMDEMKEVDAYAANLGIEMIACIQTLGHLEQIMQWAPFDAVRDTSSVLLVDEPQT